MPTKLNVLSLFDGIGCTRIALQNLGIKDDQINYIRSEISPYANECFASHNNGTNLGNVKDITADQFDQPIDIIVAGSPCLQLSSISPNSNEQLGGKDSILFFEFVRILQELRSKQADNPPAYLFENVFSMKPQTKKLISSILGTDPTTIESGFHAPNRRKRSYWTSYKLTDYHKHKTERKTLSDILENGYVDNQKGVLKDCGYCILSNTPASTLSGLKRILNKRIGTAVYSSPDYIGLSSQEKIELFESRTKEGFAPLVPEDGTPIFKTGEWRNLSLLERERGLGLPDHYTDCNISNTARANLLGKAFCVPTIEKLLFCHPKVQQLIKENEKTK